MSDKIREEFNAVYNDVFQEYELWKDNDKRKVFRCLKDEAYKIIDQLLTARATIEKLTAEQDKIIEAARDVIDLVGGCCCRAQYKRMKDRGGYIKYDPSCAYCNCGINDLEKALPADEPKNGQEDEG